MCLLGRCAPLGQGSGSASFAFLVLALVKHMLDQHTEPMVWSLSVLSGTEANPAMSIPDHCHRFAFSGGP